MPRVPCCVEEDQQRQSSSIIRRLHGLTGERLAEVRTSAPVCLRTKSAMISPEIVPDVFTASAMLRVFQQSCRDILLLRYKAYETANDGTVRNR
jgi:hypothetical protein